jgi:D-alanyl-D-alanine dipeptidase
MKLPLPATALSLLAACATGDLAEPQIDGGASRPDLLTLSRRRPPQDAPDPPPADRAYRIRATAPISELRRRIEGAVMPTEDPPAARQPDLVEPARLDPTIRLDVRYATPDNFLGEAVYAEGRVFLQREAAMALLRAQRALAAHGLGLLLHDGYRPWRVTKLFYEATPAAQRDFVADPQQGSRHNRGCAVDLSLCDLQTGRALAMPSDYDAFTASAHPDYRGGTALQRWRRDMLRAAMEAEGFAVYAGEWWHFDFASWRDYPLLDVTFEQLDQRP